MESISRIERQEGVAGPSTAPPTASGDAGPSAPYAPTASPASSASIPPMHRPVAQHPHPSRNAPRRGATKPGPLDALLQRAITSTDSPLLLLPHEYTFRPISPQQLTPRRDPSLPPHPSAFHIPSTSDPDPPSPPSTRSVLMTPSAFSRPPPRPPSDLPPSALLMPHSPQSAPMLVWHPTLPPYPHWRAVGLPRVPETRSPSPGLGTPPSFPSVESFESGSGSGLAVEFGRFEPPSAFLPPTSSYLFPLSVPSTSAVEEGAEREVEREAETETEREAERETESEGEKEAESESEEGDMEMEWEILLKKING